MSLSVISESRILRFEKVRTAVSISKCGAGDGTRTRNFQLEDSVKS
jgi:hypothetical protein